MIHQPLLNYKPSIIGNKAVLIWREVSTVNIYMSFSIFRFGVFNSMWGYDDPQELFIAPTHPLMIDANHAWPLVCIAASHTTIFKPFWEIYLLFFNFQTKMNHICWPFLTNSGMVITIITLIGLTILWYEDDVLITMHMVNNKNLLFCYFLPLISVWNNFHVLFWVVTLALTFWIVVFIFCGPRTPAKILKKKMQHFSLYQPLYIW